MRTALSQRRLAREPLRVLARCQRGDAVVEYVILLGTIAVPLVPVVIALGAWLLGVFENMRNLVVAPIP
jgi:Flp pilus assembly pilin Flp